MKTSLYHIFLWKKTTMIWRTTYKYAGKGDNKLMACGVLIFASQSTWLREKEYTYIYLFRQNRRALLEKENPVLGEIFPN